MHHDEFHHSFYHFLGLYVGSGSDHFVATATAFLAGRGDLPGNVTEAIKNWPSISRRLVELLADATVEAPESFLAAMALRRVADERVAPDEAEIVRRGAQALLASGLKPRASAVAEALRECRTLGQEIDRFVSALRRESAAIDGDHEACARRFLENCRRLDRELSVIPAKLRGVTDAL